MEIESILPESQMGFHKARSCVHAIFISTSAVHLQLRHNDGREIYGIFVDFKRAFDSIRHARLWEKLHFLRASNKFIHTVKSLYDQASIEVRSGIDLSHRFDVTESVLQGESLSPDLFLLFLGVNYSLEIKALLALTSTV